MSGSGFSKNRLPEMGVDFILAQFGSEYIFFLWISGWLPWVKRTITLDAVLTAPNEAVYNLY